MLRNHGKYQCNTLRADKPITKLISASTEPIKIHLKPILMRIHLLGKIEIITISKTNRTFDGCKNKLISFSDNVRLFSGQNLQSSESSRFCH